GTLIFVSHDRYFVERLATKIIEIGDGEATMYPGTYKEFLWHKENSREGRGDERRPAGQARVDRTPRPVASIGRAAEGGRAKPLIYREEKKRTDAEARKRQRAQQANREQIGNLEARIAQCEAAIRELEQVMAAPGFY